MEADYRPARERRLLQPNADAPAVCNAWQARTCRTDRRVFRCCLLTPRPQQMGENSALVCSTPDTVNPSAAPTALDPHLLADWERLLAQADDPVAGLLAEVVADNGPALADHFSDGMLGDTRAARFL